MDERYLVQRPEIDVGLDAFMTYVNEQLIRDIRTQVFGELEEELRRRVAPPVLSGEITNPQEAVSYIHQCRLAVENIAAEDYGGYSPARWLFYLRRLPNEAFPAYQGGLDAYKLALAEALTGVMPANVRDAGCLFPLDESVLRRVLKFSQLIVYLANLHVALQQAAKGVPVALRGIMMPFAQMSQEQADAFSLFDWRVQTYDQIPLSRVGTSVAGDPAESGSQTGFVLVPRRLDWQWVDIVGATRARVLCSYGLPFLNLKYLATLLRDRRVSQPVWTAETAALLMLSRIAAAAISIVAFRKSVLEFGYVPLSRSTLLNLFSEQFEDAREATLRTLPGSTPASSPAQLLAYLEAMQPSSWVIPGPVVRSSGDVVYLDLACASSRINSALEYPRIGGEQANARAEHFEEAVQRVIDLSQCAAALRRRKLRNSGRTVTDTYPTTTPLSAVR